MHELGLCEPIVAAVERQAAGRRVTGVRVRVGARHAVVRDSFEQAFTVAAGGTVAEDAAVDLVVTPAVATCHSCGRRTEVVDPLAACADCGGVGVEVSGGDEIVLESIELGATERRDASGEEGAADVSGDSRRDRRVRPGQP